MSSSFFGSDTLFYATEMSGFEVMQLTAFPEIMAAFVDPLGPCTQVDLVDGEPNDWELGVAFLPGMDEVRVEAACLDLRGLRVAAPAQGWTCVPQSNGWKITLAQPGRLVAITFDAPVPVAPLQPGQALRTLLSAADPPSPPAFIDPAFSLGAAYANLPPGMTQRPEGGRVVATIPPTLGTSWLLQWGVGNDATSLAPVAVTTTVRGVTIERAVTDVRLELRPDEAGGDPVLVWNHPGVLDPASGLQPVDMSPIARKRLSDRLAAANAAPTAPPTLTLPVRLVAASGGPVGVSGTDLRVTYAVDAGGGINLGLRGDPVPLDLAVPAALRPDTGAVTITARHLGRELNGPVGPAAVAGGPGVLVTGDRWAARALSVVAGGAGPAVTLAAVTVDVSADGPAELAIEVRADTQGLPGPVLAGAVVRLERGPRAPRELLFSAPPTIAAGSVVWVSARATTGTVRWFSDTDDRRPALPDVAWPPARASADRGVTWAPDDDRLTGHVTPRVRLLHRVEPPYAIPMLTIQAGDVTVASLELAATGQAVDEFAITAGAAPAALLDLLGRTAGTGPSSSGPASSGPTSSGKVTTALLVAARAALDLKIARLDLMYPPTAGPTVS